MTESFFRNEKSFFNEGKKTFLTINFLCLDHIFVPLLVLIAFRLVAVLTLKVREIQKSKMTDPSLLVADVKENILGRTIYHPSLIDIATIVAKLWRAVGGEETSPPQTEKAQS